MISQRARYALRALIYLARCDRDGPVTASELAQAVSAPPKFLESALLDLRRHRLLTVIRGSHGGYRFGRPPEEISFAEVISVIDGPLSVSPCALGGAPATCQACSDMEHCRVHPAMVELQASASRILDGWSLKQASVI
jgi:Rrf2 family protein